VSFHALDQWLLTAEQSLRAHGLTGRAAYAAVCRKLAEVLDLPAALWVDGPDVPADLALPPPPMADGVDLFGLAYERFFPEVFKSDFGQFFTPAPLARLVLALTGVRPGDRVLDPTCGAGTFLVLAGEVPGVTLGGTEVDPELVGLCRLNLALHGLDPTAVRQADAFVPDSEDGAWDVIVANPPFSVPIERTDVLRHYTLARGRSRVQSDVLFLEAAHRLLRPGGRLGVVLPWSLVSNPRFAELRAWADVLFVRRAVVGLPEGVFRPFGGAAGRAAVVVLEKRPAAPRPWIATMVDELGYDPRRSRLVRTQPDGLSRLARDAIAGRAPTVGAHETEWSPSRLLSVSGVAQKRPTVPLGQLAPVHKRRLRPSPESNVTEVDLADINKHTGEVSVAHARSGADIRGTKAWLEPGDLLVARMRPALNNVALLHPPLDSVTTPIVGSTEWVSLVPHSRPAFALVAARSEFVRRQLADTGGQTRPRTTAEAIAAAQVPLPPDDLQQQLNRVVKDALDVRLAARLRLDAAQAAYAEWGRGELDNDGLRAALDALESPDAD